MSYHIPTRPDIDHSFIDHRSILNVTSHLSLKILHQNQTMLQRLIHCLNGCGQCSKHLISCLERLSASMLVKRAQGLETKQATTYGCHRKAVSRFLSKTKSKPDQPSMICKRLLLAANYCDDSKAWDSSK